MTNLNAILSALLVLSALLTSTVSVAHAQEAGDEGTPPPEAVPPEIDAAISDAELSDLQAVASQYGISLQEAIDRYGWHNDFASAVSKIQEAAPEAFAKAEIVDAGRAWVGFAAGAPQAALDIIDAFTSSHSGVSVEVRTDLGFTAGRGPKCDSSRPLRGVRVSWSARGRHLVRLRGASDNDDRHPGEHSFRLRSR